MLQDLKNACRALLKTPWFTCVVVLTLALGIGANTAIFGVVNKLLLSSLPYPDSERLVYVRQGIPEAQFTLPVSLAIASFWRDQARSVDGVEAYETLTVLAYDDRGARVVSGMRITPGLPAFLGIAPLIGRGFTAADAQPGAPAVVLLSNATWQNDYGGTSDVVGRAITLDGVSRVVVGVMPARWDAFASPRRTGMWFPLALDPSAVSPTEFRVFEVLARLRPGVPMDAVTTELDALAKRAVEQYPGAPFGSQGRARISGPADRIAATTRDALFVLLGAVGLVLLVACSNVANLLLARGASRARELALRATLGASAWRLLRSLFAECVVLALAAGALGFSFGWLLLGALVRLRPSSLAALEDVELDAAVLVFTFGVAALTAVLFGLAPALQVASSRLAHTLRQGAAGVMRGGSGARVRKLLVAAQMALSVILLVSAGLLIRSVIFLQSADIGFDTSNLFSMQLALPRGRYTDATSRDVLSEQLLERIRALAGVVAATQASPQPPFSGLAAFNIELRTGTLSAADARGPYASSYVQPDYFDALRIRMLEGRAFSAEEMRSETAVIVNRAAAQRFWPDSRAVGAEVKIGRDGWLTVVGVVDNVVYVGATLVRDAPMFYSPYRADVVPTIAGAPPALPLLVRTGEDSAATIAAVRAATQSIDPEIALPVVQPLESSLGIVTAAPRFNMALLTAFAVIGLVLAAVGLAAVIGYEVTERTHEIGIRMALGARTENVRRLAMRHGLTPAFVGVVIGIAGALAATQLATSLLHGVAPRDPLTFVGVVALLVLVAFGASWIPARRATRVDPITALRAE